MAERGLNPLAHHHEGSALVSASPVRVFALIDDHERLSSHMSRSSWRMGGGRMGTILDEQRGQRVGSHIRMSGRALGLEDWPPAHGCADERRQLCALFGLQVVSVGPCASLARRLRLLCHGR